MIGGDSSSNEGSEDCEPSHRSLDENRDTIIEKEVVVQVIESPNL